MITSKMIAISPNKNHYNIAEYNDNFLRTEKEQHDGPISGTVMASRVRGKDPLHPGWTESRGLTSFQKKPYPHLQERFWQAWGWRTLGMAGRYRSAKSCNTVMPPAETTQTKLS